MKRKIKFIVIAFIAIILFIYLFNWYQQRKKYRFSWEKPEFATIERGNLVIPLPATGSIEPASRTEIKSKASGTILKIYFEAGDIVKKGDLLIELDPVDEQRTVDNAKAELERAKANLELARSEAQKIARDWPVDLNLALASLEAARAELHGSALNFLRMDNIRRNISPDQATFKIVNPPPAPPVKPGNPQSYIKNALGRIALAQAEADKVKELVEYGKKIVNQKRSGNVWSNIARVEYQDGLITMWKAHANLLMSMSKVRNAINTKILIDQANTRVDLAKEVLRKATVALEQAQQRLRETKVYAPINGIVEKINVREGQIISSGITTVTGGTTLMVLADVSKLFVDADVDEADIGQVRELAPPGRDAKLTPVNTTTKSSTQPTLNEAQKERLEMLQNADNVTISVDAFRDEVFTGKVYRVYPDPKTFNNVVTYNVRILLTSPNRTKLMLGMHANVKFTARKRENVLLVDIEAIKVKNEEHGVYIVGKDGKPVFVPVKLGPSDGMKIELKTDKLKPGQKVYTRLPRTRNNEDKKEDN